MSNAFDLLDLPSYSAFLNWIINLAQSHQVENVLVFDTLKALLAE